MTSGKASPKIIRDRCSPADSLEKTDRLQWMESLKNFSTGLLSMKKIGYIYLYLKTKHDTR